MFVVTADQVGSRTRADAVGPAIEALNARIGAHLVRAADRTAGDELQLLTESGSVALDATLELSRDRGWSVGIGVGDVRTPLGAGIRDSSGDAFIAARTAVDRAKRRPTRFALAAAEPRTEQGEHAQALVDLLLILRARRSEEGWQLHDLLATGITQAEAASALGITPQAVSKRARAAELRADAAATEALARLIDDLDPTRQTRAETVR